MKWVQNGPAPFMEDAMTQQWFKKTVGTLVGYTYIYITIDVELVARRTAGFIGITLVHVMSMF